MVELSSLNPWWGVLFASGGRALDVLSTWWVTPNLKLEGNPLVKTFGWKFAIIFSLLFPILGYASPALGIVIGSFSCVMAFSNMHSAFVTRHAPNGESALLKLHVQAMHACSLTQFCLASFLLILPAFFLGLMILTGTGFSGSDCASYVGCGVLAWCVAVAQLRLRHWVRFQRALKLASSTAQTAS